MEYGFKYAEKYPLCTQDQYPYTATDSKGCTHQPCLQNSYRLDGFVDLEMNSKKALYTALSLCSASFNWSMCRKLRMAIL